MDRFFNLQTIRYVVAGALALVVVMLLLVVALAVARGTSISSSQLIGLLSFVGTLVGLIGGLLGVGVVASSVQSVQATQADIQDKVNGHLGAHANLAGDQVQALIDERLRQLGLTRTLPEEGKT